jgi:hypothetical protein
MFLSLVDVTFGVALLMASLYSGGHLRSNGLRRNGENGARMRKNSADLHVLGASSRVKSRAIRAKNNGVMFGSCAANVANAGMKTPALARFPGYFYPENRASAGVCLAFGARSRYR